MFLEIYPYNYGKKEIVVERISWLKLYYFVPVVAALIEKYCD